MAVRRSFYEAIVGFDTAHRLVITKDWEFNLRALSLSPAALCRRVLARVGYHTGSQSDNVVRIQLGATKVLQFSLENHSGASPHESEMVQAIQRHSAQAFNAAYAAGDFQPAIQALGHPYLVLADSIFHLKCKILALPGQPARWLGSCPSGFPSSRVKTT